MEIKDNVLCYYAAHNDFYIYLERFSDKWSDNNTLIETVRNNEIVLSDADGYTNSINILNVEPENNLFKSSYYFNHFDNNIRGYIPSYVELQIIENDITAINNFLTLNGKETIDLHDCWVSEMFDEQNAWTSDGIYKEKNTVLNYYVFGRRIKV